MSYPVAACRGHWTAAGGAATPWYLSGGISAANCIAAYVAKGAADLSASYVNLANPGTYNAAPGTAPDWDGTNGWKFVSANSDYLTCGITPTKSWSAFIRASNVNAADQLEWAFGYYGTSGWGIQIDNNNGTAHRTVYYNNGVTTITATRTSGVWGIAGNQGYYNGVADGATMATGYDAADAIFIGDIGGAYRRYLNAYVQAFCIYNITLSTQIPALYTAMAAL